MVEPQEILGFEHPMPGDHGKKSSLECENVTRNVQATGWSSWQKWRFSTLGQFEDVWRSNSTGRPWVRKMLTLWPCEVSKYDPSAFRSSFSIPLQKSIQLNPLDDRINMFYTGYTGYCCIISEWFICNMNMMVLWIRSIIMIISMNMVMRINVQSPGTPETCPLRKNKTHLRKPHRPRLQLGRRFSRQRMRGVTLQSESPRSKRRTIDKGGDVPRTVNWG